MSTVYPTNRISLKIKSNTKWLDEPEWQARITIEFVTQTYWELYNEIIVTNVRCKYEICERNKLYKLSPTALPARLVLFLVQYLYRASPWEVCSALTAQCVHYLNHDQTTQPVRLSFTMLNNL